MRVLVVYESMYGSTRAVATHIAASRGIARLLTRRGCRVLLGPESFLVGGQNTLLEGEAVRARQWGVQVGETARAAFATNHLPQTARPGRLPQIGGSPTSQPT
jgi:hypothetical protein